ncbi:PCNA-interacting partner [Scyliorhinus canicula]|uniref:PCNA-interacting partner n=1 Tax=Scyliorhinus canicula TaxID=7830 RepID=UPI0018F4D355|nr:PCNA-interacting partner [Scyliorhinus canicula]XP_038636438.1 PCNA-interacting partner [Scyliorhinus canicula]
MDSLQQRVLQLVRRFRKGWCQSPEHERTIVCGADNMLMVLQLAMAEINKESYGEFNIALSELLLSWKHLLQDKLELLSEFEKVPEGHNKIQKTYQAFLSRSNSVDLTDVYKICAKLKPESDPAAMLSKVELLDFLLGTSKTLEDSFTPVPTSPANNNRRTISELAPVLRKLLCDYLNLLVNSKSDLALACIFNIPERGLGRAAFTDLRHTACSKQTSMYLAATSFIRCLELGAKSYAPSDNDPLMQHVKGLLDFVHFIDKLQEIMGETLDSSVAGQQILSTIIRRLLKGRSSESPFYLAAEEVSQELTARINNAVDSLHKSTDEITTNISPARPKVHAINHASAYGGRSTVKAFIALLDEEAANPPSNGKAELLYGTEQHADMIGIPCMLTLFRSPNQASGLSPKPLRRRIQEKVQEDNLAKVKNTLIKSQFFCTYKADSAVNYESPNYPSVSQTPTCVQPGSNPVLTIFCDDAPTEGESRQTLAAKPTGAESTSKRGQAAILRIAGNAEIGNRKGSRKVAKRKRVELGANLDCENLPPECIDVTPVTLQGKRGKTLKEVKTRAKNKLIPGQSKLTNFFRV